MIRNMGKFILEVVVARPRLEVQIIQLNTKLTMLWKGFDTSEWFRPTMKMRKRNLVSE